MTKFYPALYKLLLWALGSRITFIYLTRLSFKISDFKLCKGFLPMTSSLVFTDGYLDLNIVIVEEEADPLMNFF